MSGTIHKDGIPERIGSGARDVYDWLQFTALGQLVCLAVFFYGLFALIILTEPGHKIAEYLIDHIQQIRAALPHAHAPVTAMLLAKAPQHQTQQAHLTPA